MERKIEEYECAEGKLLISTFTAIRRKIMQRALAEDELEQ